MGIDADASSPFASRSRRLLVLAGVWHLTFWVLVPLFAYRMLPLDALELLGWGQEWQWGYYKHPPLGPWLGEAFVTLCGGRIESLYLLAQLTLLVTYWYVWRCARLFLDPARAALATVLLEGSYFHTYLVPSFNMNSLQLPLWAGFSFHLLRALQGRTGHWYACGAFAALCLLAKYSGLLLLATAAVLVIASPAGRRALRTPHPWLGALLALLLLVPHLAWLAEHYVLPLRYVRSFDPRDGVWNALLEPWRFAAGALIGLLFSGLLFLTLRRRGARLPWRAETGAVLALTLGPLLLAVAYGTVGGGRMKTTWAFPFFNLAGVALFLLFPTAIDERSWRRFCWALAGTIALTCGAHLAYKLGSERTKTAFDGRALAQALEQRWQARFDRPLRVVVGDHVLSAIVSSYAGARPSMLIRGDYALSPWLTPERVAREGAVVVCRAEEACFPGLASRGEAPATLTVDGDRFVYFFLPPRKPAD